MVKGEKGKKGKTATPYQPGSLSFVVVRFVGF
jgi:hypothetical protein